MSDLVLDQGQVTATAATLRGLGGACEHVVPSVTLCGSDDVIRAFVDAFTLLRTQETDLRASWAALGTQADAAVAALREADALLALAGNPA